MEVDARRPHERDRWGTSACPRGSSRMKLPYSLVTRKRAVTDGVRPMRRPRLVDRWLRSISEDRLLVARTGGSHQRSRTSAIEGKPDGRRMRPEPPLVTRGGHFLT
jgi:hypothetical protein